MTGYKYCILGGGMVAGYAAKEFTSQGVQPGERITAFTRAADGRTSVIMASDAGCRRGARRKQQENA